MDLGMNESRLISRSLMRALAAAAVAAVVAACGSEGGASAGGAGGAAASGSAAMPQAHPQAIQPTAGVQAAAAATGDAVVGDVNAHAPTLAQVRRELKQLNLCGGATSAADATPLIQSSQPGFIADPGTIQTPGELPVL